MLRGVQNFTASVVYPLNHVELVFPFNARDACHVFHTVRLTTEYKVWGITTLYRLL
jgi:hypothetical protein